MGDPRDETRVYRVQGDLSPDRPRAILRVMVRYDRIPVKWSDNLVIEVRDEGV